MSASVLILEVLSFILISGWKRQKIIRTTTGVIGKQHDQMVMIAFLNSNPGEMPLPISTALNLISILIFN